jgi:hypothetical protein
VEGAVVVILFEVFIRRFVIISLPSLRIYSLIVGQSVTFLISCHCNNDSKEIHPFQASRNISNFHPGKRK